MQIYHGRYAACNTSNKPREVCHKPTRVARDWLFTSWRETEEADPGWWRHIQTRRGQRVPYPSPSLPLSPPPSLSFSRLPLPSITHSSFARAHTQPFTVFKFFTSGLPLSLSLTFSLSLVNLPCRKMVKRKGALSSHMVHLPLYYGKGWKN